MEYPPQLKKQKVESQVESPHSNLIQEVELTTTEEKDQIILSLRNDVEALKSSEQKLKHSISELKKRESTLVMRLSTKEQEIHELQVGEINCSQLARVNSLIFDKV
jgi:hypothetical protein